MEREVSIVVEIAVTLTAISALIGIIWFTVFMGNDLANNVSIEASELSSSIEIGTLHDLKDTETEMPASAAYSLLRTYSNYIPEFVCNCNSCTKKGITQDLVNVAPCILEHLKGRVNVKVEYTDESWYKVTIEDVK